MRALILGSELISLSTAYHLSQMGYEVTVIESAQESSSKEDLETQAFKRQLENKARQAGVFFRTCTAEKFITQGKRIFGIAVRNEYNEPEIMMADRFVAALDSRGNPVLKSLGICSTSHFKSFDLGESYNPLIGKSRYSNLYLNVGYGSVSATVVPQTAKQLAEFICSPSLAELNSAPVFQDAQNSFSAYFVSLFSVFRGIFA